MTAFTNTTMNVLCEYINKTMLALDADQCLYDLKKQLINQIDMFECEYLTIYISTGFVDKIEYK